MKSVFTGRAGVVKFAKSRGSHEGWEKASSALLYILCVSAIGIRRPNAEARSAQSSAEDCWTGCPQGISPRLRFPGNANLRIGISLRQAWIPAFAGKTGSCRPGDRRVQEKARRGWRLIFGPGGPKMMWVKSSMQHAAGNGALRFAASTLQECVRRPSTR
jgi:hypothetical protein